MARMDAEQGILHAMESIGKAVNLIIKLGTKYKQELWQALMYNTLTEFTMKHLGDTFTREAVSYGELLGFAHMVSLKIFT